MSRWRPQISEPSLRHADGVVVVDLDDRAIVFPSEAAARFFHEAWSLVPALEGQVATLRQMIDEGALNAALGRVAELEAAEAAWRKERAELQEQVAVEVQRRTAATARATVLAKALRRVKDLL